MTTMIYSPSQQDHSEDRMRRAISWFNVSLNTDTRDEEFIYLWISFNAAFGDELRHPDTEGDSLRNILDRDTTEEIEMRLIGRKLVGRISQLLRNHFVYDPFRRSLKEDDGKVDKIWQERFERSQRRVADSFRRLSEGESGPDDRATLIHNVPVEVFLRLYTLRNQIFHGGATPGTGRGRKQIKDGSFMMANLVPVILTVMEADMEENLSSGASLPTQIPFCSSRA